MSRASRGKRKYLIELYKEKLFLEQSPFLRSCLEIVMNMTPEQRLLAAYSVARTAAEIVIEESRNESCI